MVEINPDTIADRHTRLHVAREDMVGNRESVAHLMADCLDTGWWRTVYYGSSQRVVKYDSFFDYLKAPFPEGAGLDLVEVVAQLKVAKHGADALGLLTKQAEAEGVDLGKLEGQRVRQLVPEANPDGRPPKNKSDNIRLSQHGTSLAGTLGRLKRDNPELAERVVAGELSANAAAIEAGFRKPTLTISSDPESAAVSIRKKFGDAFADKLKKAL